MKSTTRSAACAFVFAFSCVALVHVQGPRLSYYFQPTTTLGWAECRLESRAGSTQKIPFLPVVSGGAARAPLGTDNYSRNADAVADVVFVGDGVVLDGVSNGYQGRRSDWTTGELNVAGKAVLLAYDFPDAVEQKAGKTFTARRRIEEAAGRGAAAVILFSAKVDYPFLMISYENRDQIPRIPAITITRSSAAAILEAAGIDAADLFTKWSDTGEAPLSSDLIVRVRLRLEGAFRTSETRRFLFLARSSELDQAAMDGIADVNERSLSLIMDLFKGAGALDWPRLQTTYFADYDSKLFYTHHWGKGLASDEGVFMVHEGGVPSLGLAAHENAHILASRNWGDTTSFMSEGVGRYAEAAATEPERNDREAARFLADGKLFPLTELLNHGIGRPGAKTDVGYPAAGSFVGFLIRTYGLAAFKQAWRLEARENAEKAKADTWKTAFGKPLSVLENEWRAWLRKAKTF